MIEGGNYKRGSATELGSLELGVWSLAAATTVVWVFWPKH